MEEFIADQFDSEFENEKEIPLNRFVGFHPDHILKGEYPKYKDFEFVPVLPQIYKELILIAADKGFLAGGAVKNLFFPPEEKSNSDFDFYAYTPEKRIELYRAFLDAGFKLKKDISNCWWLEKDISGVFQIFTGKEKITVQIIKTFAGTPEQVIDEFDFTVCRIAWDGRMFYWDRDFFDNNEKKLLVIKTIQCPIGAIRRIIKYSKKGYWLSNFQIVKLYEGYANRGPEYRNKITQLLSKEDGGLTQQEWDELSMLLVGVD